MGLIIPKTEDGRVLFLLPWYTRTHTHATSSLKQTSLSQQPHHHYPLPPTHICVYTHACCVHPLPHTYREGSTIAGTTDSSTEITALPRPHEEEIQFILKEVSRFLNHQVHREDVDAAWSGIRPLAGTYTNEHGHVCVCIMLPTA